MKPVDPREEAHVQAEHQERLARIGDVLIERYGPEILNEHGHPTIDLFDYAVNRAIELEFFIEQAAARMRLMTDLDDRHHGLGLQLQKNMRGEFEMLQLRVRGYAQKLIEGRRMFQRMHGNNLGSREAGGLSST